MSEGVRKIITVLIVMVVCVVVGALVINVIAPNAVRAVVGGVEAGIHSATGLNVDLNGDGTAGAAGTLQTTDANAGFNPDQAGGMDQFQDDFEG